MTYAESRVAQALLNHAKPKIEDAAEKLVDAVIEAGAKLVETKVPGSVTIVEPVAKEIEAKVAPLAVKAVDAILAHTTEAPKAK